MNGGVVVFVHVPRTGGTTVNLAVRRAIGQYRMVDVYGDLIDAAHNYIDAIPIRTMDRTLWISGHFSFVRHSLCKPCMYATVIREPVSQLVSLYRYIRSQPLNHLYAYASRLSLADLILSGVSCEFDNGQVRQVCGVDGEFLQHPFASMANPFGRCSDKMLDCAIENLNNSDTIFGVTDELDKFMADLSQAMNVHLRAGRSNMSRSRYVPTERDLEVVRKYTRLDMELYRWTKGHLK